MSRYSPKIRKDIIEAILTAQHAHSCAFHIETVSESSPEEPPTHDYATASGVDNENTITAGADKRYAIGSGMKLMINVALYRMMEDGKTVLKDDKVRGMMRSAWDTPAFPLYNELRRYRGLSEWTQPWKPNPTVIQLMRHTHAFLAHQRGLVGPDGRFLMSEETFGQTFAALVNSTSSTQVGEFCYSNWNAMLLGFIIKHAYAKDAPLADALKCIVLDFANMTNTILDRATFEQNKGRIARPNISTAVSESHESDFLDFLDDDAALAVGGGFSCVEDMAKLLKFMLKARLDGDEMMKRKFFSSTDTFADKSLGIARLPLECTLLWIPPQLVQSHSSGFQDQIRIYTTSSDAALASRFQRSLRQEP
jgi:CubicO group peptidase (beta-lactamase class C family)